MSNTYNKNKLGMEDLVETTTATQVRNGETITVNGVIAANIQCKDSMTVLEYIEFLEARIAALEAV
jgi:fructosamine-3-kinase